MFSGGKALDDQVFVATDHFHGNIWLLHYNKVETDIVIDLKGMGLGLKEYKVG